MRRTTIGMLLLLATLLACDGKFVEPDKVCWHDTPICTIYNNDPSTKTCTEETYLLPYCDCMPDDYDDPCIVRDGGK